MNPFKISYYAKAAMKTYKIWEQNLENNNNDDKLSSSIAESMTNTKIGTNTMSPLNSPLDSPFDLNVLQAEDDTCAIHAQYHVLKEYGYSGSVDDLIKEASAKGWYTQGGTAPEDVGNLLESNGVPCKNVTNASIFDLMDEIAKGKSVIVSVDLDELVGNQDKFSDFFDNLSGTGANHAITIRNFYIDRNDPGNSLVVCTDSGTGHIAKTYPIAHFMDAWQDGKFRMIVPLDPPPQDMNLERLANFNYDTGIIPEFNNMSSREFYNDYLSGISETFADEPFEANNSTDDNFNVSNTDNFCNELNDFGEFNSDDRFEDGTDLFDVSTANEVPDYALPNASNIDNTDLELSMDCCLQEPLPEDYISMDFDNSDILLNNNFNNDEFDGNTDFDSCEDFSC